MPVNDQPLWPGVSATYGDPYRVWDTAYPAGRGQAASGWTCPGCGRGYNPDVAACWVCPLEPVTATGTNPATAMHPCPEPLKGGKCGCGEGGDQ